MIEIHTHVVGRINLNKVALPAFDSKEEGHDPCPRPHCGTQRIDQLLVAPLREVERDHSCLGSIGLGCIPPGK